MLSMFSKHISLALCAMTLCAALVSGAVIKSNTTFNNYGGTVANSAAYSKSGPAIASNSVIVAPSAHRVAKKPAKRVPIAAPAPAPVLAPVTEAPVNAELEAAREHLLKHEQDSTTSFENCDEWNNARVAFETLAVAAGENVDASTRPNGAAKSEACKPFVEFLDSVREEMEELAVHLHDLTTGASSMSRLDLVDALVTDQKELEKGFEIAPMLKDEFEHKVQTDERLGNNYYAFEGLLESLKQALAPSLAEQLREHPEFLPALGELEKILPALEAVKEAAEKVNSSVDKLRNVVGVEAGIASATVEEPAAEQEPEPELEEAASPKPKPSELAQKFHP